MGKDKKNNARANKMYHVTKMLQSLKSSGDTQ